MFKKYLYTLFVCAFLLSFSPCLLAKPQATLNNGSAELSFNNGEIVIKEKGKQRLHLTSIQFNYETVDTWKVISVTDQQLTLMASFPAQADFYRVVTDVEPRLVKLTVTKLNSGFRLYASPAWGRQITLEFKHLGDHFFGLSAPLQPDNRLSPDLTGTVTHVDIYSEGAAYRENYASAFSAFFISSNGYGSFFDTFARGRYELAINGANRIHHDTGTLDWYVFLGEQGADIHRAYYDVIGDPKSVPMWALGPVGWRDQNDGGAEEILDDVKKLSDMEIPFTSWFVDRPYSDGAHAWSKLNFSQKFANPKKWINKIREDYNMEFMTWVSPATFGDARFNKHLDGKFSYIDLSDPQSVSNYQQELIKKHYAVGVKGHKIDRADEGFPVSEEWYDQTPVAERRNKYAYLMAQVHDQALRNVFGEDQVTFARTAIHRTQPYLSAIWGGDPRTSWEGLQGNFSNAMRSSFMGFPVWGTDVGGYQGDGFIPEDLYLRWMQAGSMTGLFEIKLDGAGGSGRDRMPWQYDKQFQQKFKKICDERMQFLPYLYSLANNSGDMGVIMQPLAYRHLNDENTYDIWDQFYLGEAILVAPVFDNKTSRKVYLPKGKWRDFNATQNLYKGGKTYRVDADIGTLPRFIKEGSLYITGNIYQANDVRWQNGIRELTLHAFPSTRKETVEFSYVDALDNDEKKIIKMDSQRKSFSIDLPAVRELKRMEVLISKAPEEVRVNGEEVTFDFDKNEHKLVLLVDGSQKLNVVVE